MEDQNKLQKQQNQEEIDNNLRLNFYKLHYPNRKSPRSVSKASNKMRSKSLVSVLESNHNDEIQIFNPKGSIRKLAAARQIKKQVRSYSMFAKQNQKHANTYKQAISFKTALSIRQTKRDLSSATFAINSIKQLEDFAKKSINVRIALQRAKDQKIKLNKIVLSHKQTQEVKLQYLMAKKQEIEFQINQQILLIYQQFFKKQYQASFGQQQGTQKFQEKIFQIINILNHRVFGNQ